jgi:hypothetical protein
MRVALTLVNVAVLIPVTNHLSGTRQNVNPFADLQGNLRLLLVYLTASWILGAFCEEAAFRGFFQVSRREVRSDTRHNCRVHPAARTRNPGCLAPD